MGRHKTNAVYSYFALHGSRECATAACKLAGCCMILRHPCATNLKKHLERHHQAEFIELSRLENSNLNSNIYLPQDDETSNITTSKRIKMFNEKLCPLISIPMDITTFNDAMVELVTLNGRPFSAVEDSGLCKIIDPIKNALNCSMDMKKISKLVDKKVSDIVKRISEELQCRMFSIKVDIASHLDTNIVSINAQFINGDSVQMRTLSVTTTSLPYSDENIKELILNVLMKFELGVHQVYTVTTDKDNYIRKIGLNSSEGSGANGIDELKVLEIVNVFSSKCTSLYLQLAIKDSLSAELLFNTITNSRNFVKKLRTSNIMKILKMRKYNVPILDSVTRWISTYDMISRLIELQQFINEFAELIGIDVTLSNEDWEKLHEIQHVLEPAKKATVLLQMENLTPGDFYKVWFLCKNDISKIKSEMAHIVVESMNDREKEFRDEVVVLSSLYLDPRFNVILSDTEQELAINHLSQLHTKMCEMGPKLKVEPSTFENVECSTSEDDLENMLRTAANEKKNSVSSPNINIVSALQDFKNIERIPADSNLITWWNTMKIRHEELFKLAVVVHAVPMTHITMDKFLSHFEIIVGLQQQNLLPENISNVLFVRSNFNT